MTDASPKPVSFLVVSDVHFGKLAVSKDFSLPDCAPALECYQGGVPMKENLVATINGLSESFEAMLVSGDLTSVASPSEFHGSIAAMWELADQVGIPRSSVFFTFGNHDVDWRICALANGVPSLPKDERYHHIAASVGGLILNSHQTIVPGPLPGTGVWKTEHVALFVANSGYYCRNDQEYRHGKLGEDQFKWLEDELVKTPDDGRWRLLMVHHHPFNYAYPHFSNDISCIEEGAELVDLIGKHGIDFIAHGHRHHPRIFTETRNGWKRPATFMCAGSLAVNQHHRNFGQIPNTFHIARLEKRLSDGSAFGSLKTFEYANSDGWRPIQHSKETPLDQIQSFGAFATKSDLETFARKVISDSLAKAVGPQSTVLLPSFYELVPQLQCCSLQQLNELFKRLAPAFSHKVIGRYPETVGLISA